jgi:diguanylate cyclase (GGDEF)-like protein/PAS domain S-box-containing protein
VFVILRPGSAAAAAAAASTSSGALARLPELLDALGVVAYTVADDAFAELCGAVQPLLGTGAAELIGREGAPSKLVHTADAEAVERDLKEAVAAGRPYALEYRLARPDVPGLWVRDLGHPVEGGRRSGLLFDVCSQREIVHGLQRQTELLDALLESTPDHVYFKDALGRFLRVSAAQARWLGLARPEDAVGRSDFDFFAAPHAQRAAIDEREIMRSGRAKVNLLEQDIWKSGRIAWVSTTKMPLRGAGGAVVGTFGVTRDVTRQRLVEVTVQENEERMRAIIATQRDAASSRDPGEVLDLITQRAASITRADGAALLLLEEGRLVVRTASGILAEAVGKVVDSESELARCWLHDGLPRRYGDAQVRPDVAAAVAGVGEARSLALAPVHHERTAYGLLEVVSREPAMFQTQDEEALELLSVMVTAALGQQELRVNAELAEHRALHDSLTGLPNRVLFDDRIRQALLAVERDGGEVAVALLDLDHFKEINDTLGHGSGDQILMALAERLGQCVRASDTVARLGGDEFGLLLRGRSSAGALRRVLGRLAAEIERPVEIDGLPLGIEGSIGVAVYPEDGRSSEELIRGADVAMYNAKQEGRPYAFYERSIDHFDVARLTLIGELRAAIEAGELVLHYQPKAALEDGSVTSVEALLRWQHPARGLLPPAEFLPQALQTGLVKPLTRFVLDEALRQAGAWHAAGLDLAVAVNVGTRNLIDASFPAEVAAALEQAGADADWICVEIPESTMLDEASRMKSVLAKLSKMGVRLSIDDFGTGYSSLSYLRQLPVSEIKIDRSFVIGMGASADDAVIVRSTIDLARNLGLQVVAEGVEDEAAWQRLKSLGCGFAQGFYICRPVPPDDFVDWLRRCHAA